MNYSLEKISSLVHGTLFEKTKTQIQYLSIDSRTINSPQDSIFFAINGLHHNGHVFIDDLYQKKVRSFVINSAFYESTLLQKFPEANFIIVDDTLVALQTLCAFHRQQFDFEIVGITGSNGKTIVKEWLFQVLHHDRKICRSPKSYNSQVGVPLSVWQLSDNYDFAIFEAGISKVGEMQNLQKIISPSIGIFTNIGDAHQENFETIEQKAIEKMSLFIDSQLIIYCKDYQAIQSAVEKFSLPLTKLKTWSKNQSADLQIIDIEQQSKSTFLKARYQNAEIHLEIPFTDKASQENCITIWLTMLSLGYKNAIIQERILQLVPIAMRLELKEGINNSLIINDSYNSDINSIRIALDFLNQHQKQSKKTLILSDIFQSGYSKEVLYQEVAKILEQNSINKLIGIGESISQNLHAFDSISEHNFYRTTEEFLANFSYSDFSNETILLKGSRDFRFERILNLLQKKTHRTVLEIDLGAITHNLNYFRSLLKPQTKMMLMVKAFAYGSGSFEVARLLQFQRADYLGVAYIDEGIELRKAGITLPIMVMNPEFEAFSTLIENNLEPEIYNFKGLELFHEQVKRSGIDSYPVHIKIDTGMRRLGFEEKDLEKLLPALQNFDNLRVQSIFSHLVGSDEEKFDDFTHKQLTDFQRICDKIIQICKTPVLRHILNSSGIERFSDFQFEMVRLGIGLYGISALHQDKLMNISTLKTHISQIKTLDSSQTVGYSRRGVLNRESKIATIAIGYADGWNRKFGNGVGEVLINGQSAKIVGNICMDMCMVDVTDMTVNEGDEVILFGEGINGKHTIIDLAQRIGTIPYEILTSISQRVKKIYFVE